MNRQIKEMISYATCFFVISLPQYINDAKQYLAKINSRPKTESWFGIVNEPEVKTYSRNFTIAKPKNTYHRPVAELWAAEKEQESLLELKAAEPMPSLEQELGLDRITDIFRSRFVMKRQQSRVDFDLLRPYQSPNFKRQKNYCHRRM